MKRWVYFSICIGAAVALFVAGRLLPIHLRAVDARVLQRAGEKTSSVVDSGLALVQKNNISSAELLWETAQQEKIPGHEKLRATIDEAKKAQPSGKNQTFTEYIIQTKNREIVLGWLRESSSPVVQQLLRCRALTNTVLFPSAQSSAGQAFDAALATCGRLLQNHNLEPGLTDAVSSTTAAALRGESSQPLEQILLDFMSLGRRFTWNQLVTFCAKIEDVETLRLLANLTRKENAQLPILFSAVQLSEKPAAVTKYLMNFSQTGSKDLASSLHFGAGGLNELLNRNQRLQGSSVQGNLNASSAALVYLPWQMPKLALALKWSLYFAAGFLLALALHLARPRAPVLERPLQVRGIHFIREILFGLGFLFVVLLLSEPFLAQGSQRVEFPLRLRLPMVGSATPAGILSNQTTFMNPEVLITMSIFFVLQTLLYIMCLVKLAEIRRQKVAPRIKLRLLENEDHLFDSGLYLGFLGTIVSFVLTSIHVFEHLNLMAAYSATSFGILFVVLFKVVHLRPARRKLLLEAETSSAEESAASARPFVSPL